MITYLTLKWVIGMGKEDIKYGDLDYSTIVLGILGCLFTLMIDIVLIFLQPLFICMYWYIISKIKKEEEDDEK